MTQKQSILLVEDDLVQRTILSRMLEAHYTVQSRDTYREAVNSLDNPDFTPDLILCDMYLPDGTGMDLRKQLQGHDALRSCPFIFLSGTANEKIRNDAALLGIDDFLSKPIANDTLLSAVERVLTRSRQLKQAHAQRLDQQITDPLHPDVPQQIGSHTLTLRYSEMAAGGGDFVFHLKGHDMDYILFGDVVGHGAPAKFFLHAYTGYLYGMVRALKHHMLPSSAAELLMVLNQEIVEDTFLKRWLFTCIAVCIPNEGPITLANAGHPSAWLTGRNSTIPLTQRGPMPGLMPHMVYPNSVVTMKPGERIFISSDGAPLNKKLLDSLRSMSADQAISIAMHTGDPNHRDDSTVLIIEHQT